MKTGIAKGKERILKPARPEQIQLNLLIGTERLGFKVFQHIAIIANSPFLAGKFHFG